MAAAVAAAAALGGCQAGHPGSGAATSSSPAAAGTDTGMAAIQDVDGKELIGPSSGTSAGAPFWAGIIALADQYAGRHLGFINTAIYRIGRSPRYRAAFHDITTGDLPRRNRHRLPGRTGLGSGHQLGQSQRPGPRPAARRRRVTPASTHLKEPA